MFGLFSSSREAEMEAFIKALNRSQAVIQFNLDGTIIDANENFLNAVGYRLEEIKGKHHRLFVDPAYANSAEYNQFWDALARGEYQAGEYKRFNKSNKEIWIQASYNPLFDSQGRPFKVVKYATDITSQKLQNADYSGQISAISKSQAVIQFNLDGVILDANENFLNALGYKLEEIKGKHHRMFVDSDYGVSPQYQQFWEALGRGEYQTGEYKRFGKGNREVWIQASYNPIFDMNGKPFKVVKYASDVTRQILKREHNQRTADNFYGRVQGIVSSIATASTELATTAETMSKTIYESNANVQDAVSNTAETYHSVQSVAAAAEEMSSTIQEISSQTQSANKLISDSVEKVRGADNHANELRIASQKVKSVIQLISNISSQINLLALNATIESARAGEAGKGFAVVANEVRNLAGQTDKSIQEIEKVIRDMSSASDDVVTSLGGIKEAVDKIYIASCGIASAVEEQSAVMNDIAQNMNLATHKTQSVKENITIVGKLSGETELSSQQVLGSAQGLSKQSEQLDKEVSNFLTEISAA